MNAERASAAPVGPAARMVWLLASERSTLRGAIESFRGAVTCLPHVDAALTGTLTELDVVEARDAMWPATSAVTRRAGSLPHDSVPVRLTADELGVLTTLPTLTGPLRDLLTGTVTR